MIDLLAVRRIRPSEARSDPDELHLLQSRSKNRQEAIVVKVVKEFVVGSLMLAIVLIATSRMNNRVW
ncbi:MAG: hypothetical protein WC030_03585 [Candidatus Paceibacterota bacterium]